MRVTTFSLVMILSVGSSACWLVKKKATPVLPPPPQPALAKPAPVIAPPSDVVIPTVEPPSVPTPLPKVEEPPKEKPPVQEPEQKPPPVEKKRPAHRPVTEAPKLPEPEAAGAAGPSGPLVPPPQLREILTPQKRHQYETEYGRSMGRARSAMGRASGRNLTPAQQEMLIRIRTFLDQAEESRKDDLGTAWQLARRADLLGQDLLESLR